MTTNVFADLFDRDGRRRLSHALQHGALVAIAWLLARLGVDRASALMGRAWRLFAPLNARHARADTHLAMAFPDWSAEKRREVLGDMWENLGRTAAETILLPELLAEPERVAWTDHDGIIDKALSGAFFVSLHAGNWEVVSVPLARAGVDLRAVYKPLRNPAVERWLVERRRALYGNGLMPLDRTVALKMMSAAKSGATLAVLGDLRDDTRITVTFFGRDAHANPFPAMLARKLGLPIVVARTIRRDGARFEIDAVEIEVARTDDQKADIQATTQAIHDVYERWIREYPAQWMWAHRKWWGT